MDDVAGLRELPAARRLFATLATPRLLDEEALLLGVARLAGACFDAALFLALARFAVAARVLGGPLRPAAPFLAAGFFGAAFLATFLGAAFPATLFRAGVLFVTLFFAATFFAAGFLVAVLFTPVFLTAALFAARLPVLFLGAADFLVVVLPAVAFLAGVFFAAAFLAGVFLAGAFLAAALRGAVFFTDAFRAAAGVAFAFFLGLFLMAFAFVFEVVFDLPVILSFLPLLHTFWFTGFCVERYSFMLGKLLVSQCCVNQFATQPEN